MFYKGDSSTALTRTEMDAVRKAFRGKLLRLRYSPQFILNNADELLAIAHSEYARAIGQGVEVEDPVAWTIHCAWRRTQNLLQAENLRPRDISGDHTAELVDEDGVLPEEEVMEADRARKIRDAVAKLDEDQRQIVALTFFEEMSVREAARHLGCSASSVQHRRETALRTLRRFLPVTESEELVVDVAMACWLSFAVERAGVDLPAGFEAIIDRAGHGASGLWSRVHDLARRYTVGGGNETATAIASSGGGRAAGVCATAIAVVCLAGAGTTGLVGPGIGVVAGDGHAEPKIERAHRVETAAERPHRRGTVDRRVEESVDSSSSVETAAATTTTSLASSAPHRRAGAARKSSPSKKKKKKQASHRTEPSSRPSRTEATVGQEKAAPVEEEFSGITQAGSEAADENRLSTTAIEQSSSTSTPPVVDKQPQKKSSGPKDSAADQFGIEN